MDFRPEGWMFGGQLGGRYQINQLVLGVEATADWADLRDEIVFAGGGERENLKVQALYTVTGQVGWAFDRWLPYVKGGWAAASTKAVFDSGGGDVATHSHEANGWTVGGGVDYAIWQNVIFGVEYDHFELKYDPFTEQFPVGTPWVVTSSSHLTIDQVVARLSYKFDWH